MSLDEFIEKLHRPKLPTRQVAECKNCRRLTTHEMTCDKCNTTVKICSACHAIYFKRTGAPCGKEHKP